MAILFEEGPTNVVHVKRMVTPTCYEFVGNIRFVPEEDEGHIFFMDSHKYLNAEEIFQIGYHIAQLNKCLK